MVVKYNDIHIPLTLERNAMNNIERKEARARFREFLDSPAIKKSLDLKVSNGDTQKYDPTKMPSPERIDAINKAYLSAL